MAKITRTYPVIFRDTFNRADSNTVGNGWTENEGTGTECSISYNTLQCVDNSSSSQAVVTRAETIKNTDRVRVKWKTSNNLKANSQVIRLEGNSGGQVVYILTDGFGNIYNVDGVSNPTIQAISSDTYYKIEIYGFDYSAKTWKIDIDGEFIGTYNMRNNIGSSTFSDFQYFGTNTSGTGYTVNYDYIEFVRNVTIQENYHDLFTGCVLYLDMNGDAKDVTNNNNDGTVNGATLTTDHLGSANRAYSFDGSNDSITVSDSSSLDIGTNDFTISAWIKTGSTITENGGSIINKRAQGSGLSFIGYSFGYRSTGVPRCIIDDTDYGIFDSTTSLSADTWYLITFVCDRDNESNCLWYINGQATSMSNSFQSTFAATAGSLANSEDLLIGHNNYPAASDYFDGTVSEVFIHERALSASEAALLYQLTSKKYIYPYGKVTQE